MTNNFLLSLQVSCFNGTSRRFSLIIFHSSEYLKKKPIRIPKKTLFHLKKNHSNFPTRFERHILAANGELTI